MAQSAGNRPREGPLACVPTSGMGEFLGDFLPRGEESFQLREFASMKVIPVGNKVVVKRIEAEDKSAGGILLPDSAKEKPQQGKVLSVGDGSLLKDGRRVPMQVHEGDKVLFANWAGTEVKVAGQDLLILREDDILAILE